MRYLENQDSVSIACFTVKLVVNGPGVNNTLSLLEVVTFISFPTIVKVEINGPTKATNMSVQPRFFS